MANQRSQLIGRSAPKRCFETLGSNKKMDNRKKGCIVAVVGNLVYIPCLIGVLVSFAVEAYVSVAICFILLFVLPQIALRMLNRKLFGPKETREQPDYGKCINITEQLCSKKKLWIIGVFILFASLVASFAYLSTLPKNPTYSAPVMIGVVLASSLATTLFAIYTLWLLKSVFVKFNEHKMKNPNKSSDPT